ncbi:hypothetical protein BO86DRAFT_86131 [Aspergillus japonicus CBS 114.51]|uniref:Uncharacterized protein n=1 Tax=Aspergillus japonicus CBS 114.51 TaxID=1448312 RepID=A0A8T8X2I9_ASPJA|nr:hypothetical protein BO86DRAFT_86131 [Aspergillus japonicus CBS 114.51]RAH82275.1 hypothetical protein BO86DRAFT_86131 [Aspergillus japonicus CBS 114.51]
MARRYHIDELLWLRGSPLVVRPPTLPPVDEWMGPIPDPTTQRKTSNSRESTNPNETTPRRPSLFDTRHMSRNSNSEDIILGPPKTAFASASRIAGKGSIDSTDRSSRPHDAEDLKTDRFAFRDKFFKERDPNDRDFDRRDGKMGAFNARRGDKEDWINGRPRRTFGPEEQDRKPRRNGEFDRWDTRDQREPTHDRTVRDSKDTRFTLRKDGTPGRARHEGSWFREDNAPHETPEAEEDKTPIRNREWRRDRHGADRDWTRGAKLEQEPEWLDTNDKDEYRRVHTQEDFERWKERMKAGSQPHATDNHEVPAEIEVAPPQQQPDTRPTDGEIFSSNGTPFQQDSAMERFFGLLSESKPAPAPAPAPEVSAPPVQVEATPKKEAQAAKAMKSSRFAGLFSPPPGSPARDPEPQHDTRSPALTPAGSTDADQEGFQRILLMLGGGKSRNGTPHNDTMPANRPPSLVQAEQVQSAVSSPSREHIKRQEYLAMLETPSRAAGPPFKENPYPPETQARDREHLLRLMQQVRVTPVNGPAPGGHNQPQSAGPVPGMMNMPDVLSPPPGIPPVQKGPNFLDDPAIANIQRADAEHLRRRPVNGPPMGYFDDIPFPPGGQVPITPGGTRAPHGQGHPPMGMQRPPGFEHMPPPGWAGPQMPPQPAGGPAPLAPPPGIPTPTRGVNPTYMANMMPMHGNAPPLNEREPFPRANGGGSAGFPPPPGMMPPPGYMNGPPPSFPPMPHNGDVMMGLGPRGQPPFEGVPPPQGPPPSSRHLLDMFGQVGGDVRGGMIGPGQFR